MKFLITGASGLIGKNLLDKLLKKDVDEKCMEFAWIEYLRTVPSKKGPSQ